MRTSAKVSIENTRIVNEINFDFDSVEENVSSVKTLTSIVKLFKRLLFVLGTVFDSYRRNAGHLNGGRTKTSCSSLYPDHRPLRP